MMGYHSLLKSSMFLQEPPLHGSIMIERSEVYRGFPHLYSQRRVCSHMVLWKWTIAEYFIGFFFIQAHLSRPYFTLTWHNSSLEWSPEVFVLSMFEAFFSVSEWFWVINHIFHWVTPILSIIDFISFWFICALTFDLTYFSSLSLQFTQCFMRLKWVYHAQLSNHCLFNYQSSYR